MKHIIRNRTQQQQQKQQHGTTLIELLVATAIMGIIVITLGATLVQVIKGERRAIALQNVQDNIRFALEIMGKELRLAQPMNPVDIAPCNSDRNYVVSGANDIAFKSDEGDCIRYWVSNGQLMKQVDEDTDGSVDSQGAVTSNEIFINSLTFTKLFDDVGENPNHQPSITINIDVSSKNLAFQDASTMRLQTTVTQRSLDVTP
ncbi:MAG: hypothetical protein A2666_00110 [Parcubacteria group bacterium RIFCSPHIGHO2_01_FULL_47_10b]|nr:MAG: hypothetical protein A2666_00110 [Parcubacteria group bacterium RIFCSPHIGHO2_01_FULL_47_10b]